MDEPKYNLKRQRGQISLTVLLFGFLAIIILTGFVLWADANLKAVRRDSDQASAFYIAEAGIEYYRWHLAHSPADFQDGTGAPGPYPHDYFDKNGSKIGRFTLEIAPPPAGSTVVTIRSTGQTENDPSITKIIEAKLAIPSFSQYAVISNSSVNFGEGTEIFGLVHSNGGVRFDGIARNLVTSALSQYNDPDHSGNVEYAVHTHVPPIDPAPPGFLPVRLDVFKTGRQMAIPAVDFTGLTSNLAEIKTAAQSGGRYLAPSGDDGYHVILKTDDTFNLYRVTKITDPPSGCISVLGQKNWGSWSIDKETLIGTYPFPANGIIFAEDDVWVEGQLETARLTIAAGRFPENFSTYATIAVNKDILYTHYDGQEALGLIAQRNITVGWASEDNLRLDAALVAQHGRVGRYYYKSSDDHQERCGPYHVRQSIILYGMVASNKRYGFAYSDGTGYQIRNIVYDSNLRYGPPPSFPLTSDYYDQIFWGEIE